MGLILTKTSNNGRFSLSGTNGRFSAFPPPTSVVASGLVLHLDAGKASSYPGSGTTWTDLSGNGNHATLYNSPTFASATNGGELIFNGSSQYGTTPTTNFPYDSDSGGNYIAAAPGTISVWAKASVGTGARQIFAYGGWGGRQARTLGQADGTLQAYFSPTLIGDSQEVDTGISTPLNTWFHLTLVYSGTQVSIYRDGSLVAGPTNRTLYTTSAAPLAGIARTVTNTPFGDKEYWQGSIGSILVYNRALSGAEIAQNYSLQWGTI